MYLGTRHFFILLWTIVSGCNISSITNQDKVEKLEHTIDSLSLLLASCQEKESELNRMDSLFNSYWLSLADKQYENDTLKIRPDLELDLLLLLNECNTYTQQLINLYGQLSDYTTIYQDILTQINEDSIFVDEEVLDIIQSHLEQYQTRNVGIPNKMAFLDLYYAQLGVRSLELLRKEYPDDIGYRGALLSAQAHYEMLYDSAYYVE